MNADDGSCHLVGFWRRQAWGGGHEGECGRWTVDRSLGIALLLQLRDEILGRGKVIIETFFPFGMGDVTRFALPHITQHLNMAGDLLPGPFYTSLLEIINEELVSPPRTAAREGGPGRLPVLAKTCVGE